MPQKKEAELAEFVKLQNIGAAVMGRIAMHKENDNGPFVVVAPAMYRANKTDKLARYAELAVGLTTDVRGKITKADEGTIVLVVLVGAKSTTKGNPMKLFNVWTLSPNEAATIATAGTIPPELCALDEKAAAPATSDDELPF